MVHAMPTCRKLARHLLAADAQIRKDGVDLESQTVAILRMPLKRLRTPSHPRVHIPRQTARLAYYAQFHAARALISSAPIGFRKLIEGEIQFHKLGNEDARLDRGLAGDLAATYRFKEAAGNRDRNRARFAP